MCLIKLKAFANLLLYNFLLNIVFFISFAKAQNIKGEFSERDIAKIEDFYKNHKLKFDKFYKQKIFIGEFTLTSITPGENLFTKKKGYIVELKRGGPLPSLHFVGYTTCFVTDQSFFDELASWNPGNSWSGQLISTSGFIKSVTEDYYLSLSKQNIYRTIDANHSRDKRIVIACDDTDDPIVIRK